MENYDDRLLTAAEFAAEVNLSDRQIRRLVKSGRIQAQVGEDRIARIPASELERFHADGHVRPDRRTDAPASGRTFVADGHVRPDRQAADGQTSDMSAELFTRLHDRALSLLEEERQERQAAQRAALQMQSQLQGLQHTLQSYQRALTENAESIAERESLRLAAEKQALELAQERESIQDEHQALLEKLKLAQDRTSWLEKRVSRLPRWVRRWLDVG